MATGANLVPFLGSISVDTVLVILHHLSPAVGGSDVQVAAILVVILKYNGKE